MAVGWDRHSHIWPLYMAVAVFTAWTLAVVRIRYTKAQGSKGECPREPDRISKVFSGLVSEFM